MIFPMCLLHRVRGVRHRRLDAGALCRIICIHIGVGRGTLRDGSSLLVEALIGQFGGAFGGVYQLDDSRSDRTTDKGLNSDAIHRGGLACCGCRHHLAASSIGVLSITLRFCREVSMHLAKGTEKAAAAPIADRPRDLLN